ncbi:glycosyltransferase [Streptomyces sp. BI20]|uniref:glycosyltransferase n=1 Tax=Streptomyces sp. BI20 TaxID=3403460 RepID=UPI003C7215CA
MRIGLLTDGGARLWCERLVRGLPQHEFALHVLAREAEPAPTGPADAARSRVAAARTAALWAPGDDGRGHGRRDRRRFADALRELVTGICAGTPEPFSEGLHGLAELARDKGGMYAALRSETAIRVIEAGCRARGVGGPLAQARVPDLLEFADELERTLRPLSLPWYGPDALGGTDLVHAAAGGVTALPGLLAKRFCGVPLLLTEYGSHLRGQYLEHGGDRPAPRALRTALHQRLAAELYAEADLVTAGNTHARRWQEHAGAPRDRLHTVYPGMAADRFAPVAEAAERGDPADPDTLAWVGRPDPAKDLIGLLHAFARVRRARPAARLRLFTATPAGPEGARHLDEARSLAAHLFPDQAAHAHTVGESPVSFEEIGGPEAPTVADAYAAGRVLVLSSVVEGFPIPLVEAMLCGRATVSTDTGAVCEVIGGTGLVVPARNPAALADACLALLADPERAARLGAAARERALTLFTVERTVARFGELYLRLVARAGAPRPTGDAAPFAVAPEAVVPGHWTSPHWAAPTGEPPARETPARETPARDVSAAPTTTAPEVPV